jgi:lipid-A-disaccharide synthase
MQAVDILILSNGPGEVATWVRPVVQALREHLGMIGLKFAFLWCCRLVPMPVVKREDRTLLPTSRPCTRTKAFLAVLLWGKTAENWDWRKGGVVLFLGGDQFFPVLIGLHLGYRTVIYAEWEARWYRWIDRFGVMKPEIATQKPQKYADKFTVVGDLMVEAQEREALSGAGDIELIGLLPGSKPVKLAQECPSF